MTHSKCVTHELVTQQWFISSTYSFHNYRIKSLILSRWCSKKNNWREFYMWHKKIISSWLKYTENKKCQFLEKFCEISKWLFRLINVMREFEEFTQYRQRFKPFRKLSETQINDIVAAFENKAKYLIENEIQKLKLNFQNAQKCNERNFDKKWMSKFWLKYRLAIS